MSGMLQMLLAAGYTGGLTPTAFIKAGNEGLSGTQSTTLAVQGGTGAANPGTMNASGNATNPFATNVPWYSPPNTAQPALWVRMTVTAGTASDTPANDAVWQNISGGGSFSWTWTRTVAGTTTATITVELATDSGGVTVISSTTGIAVSVITF